MWHLGIHNLDGLNYLKKIIKCPKQDGQHVSLTTLSRSHVNAMRVFFQILAHASIEFAQRFKFMLFLLRLSFFLDLDMMVFISFVPFMLKHAKPTYIV